MQQPERGYTYADYAQWDGIERYELIDGQAYMLASPSVRHQRVFRELFKQFAVYLAGKTCEVFSAPFDIRLNAAAEDDIVVQPDITVICDPRKIEDGQSCKGAPDMVIEILSPSTARYDQNRKLDLYLEAGVREYWIVDPEMRSVR
ncbi:Uma2 family endonuclease, partial [Eubacteriales bacterium OttesenSCG-928-A19]|nr:Uma2 family endonuclease [Eubacteriales bacterium OttesenSCG-928-A19]